MNRYTPSSMPLAPAGCPLTWPGQAVRYRGDCSRPRGGLEEGGSWGDDRWVRPCWEARHHKDNDRMLANSGIRGGIREAEARLGKMKKKDCGDALTEVPRPAYSPNSSSKKIMTASSAFINGCRLRLPSEVDNLGPVRLGESGHRFTLWILGLGSTRGRPWRRPCFNLGESSPRASGFRGSSRAGLARRALWTGPVD